MSYVSTDFDNLDKGFNILNITETISSLLQYEGTFSDKGKGYKQQYMTFGNKLDVPFMELDFCIIFKDGLRTSNFQRFEFNQQPITITPTITNDSDGNVVWLYENVSYWTLSNGWFDDFTYFRLIIFPEDKPYILHSKEPAYDVVTGETKQPDEFPIIVYKADDTNISFEAKRSSPTSSDLKIKFEGTFYNGSLGLSNNIFDKIVIFHRDNNNNIIIDKTLVNGTDFTLDGNKVYSGISTIPTEITISSGILYNQQNAIIMELSSTAQQDQFFATIPKGIPVFNWKDGEFNVNGTLYVSDTDGDNPVDIGNGVIQETGTNANGRYIKYTNGIMICTKEVAVTKNVTTTWGDGYTTGSQNTISLGNFAAEFNAKPVVNITNERVAYNSWISSVEGTTKTFIGNISLLRFTSQSNVSSKIHVIAIGMWK